MMRYKSADEVHLDPRSGCRYIMCMCDAQRTYMYMHRKPHYGGIYSEILMHCIADLLLVSTPNEHIEPKQNSAFPIKINGFQFLLHATCECEFALSSMWWNTLESR